ncbi:MAG: hypothetical protein HOV76_13440 [Hamadaea sp.]|nr:hypothetical protein [Hamadaea sp.]
MPPVWRRPAVVAFALGLLGVGFRVWLTARDAPLTNSDEATIGLAALHIWRGEDFPVYFYGQHYMGTIEAYLAAPFVGLLGPTTLALRLPTLALFALFLPLMYALVRRVYSPWMATATVGLLALGSDRIVKNQLIAGGGYPETSPMMVALLLGVLAVSRSEKPRPWITGGIGLLGGLIIWNHLLPLPYLAGAALLLIVFARRQLVSRAGWTLAGGLLLGASPLIWHDLHNTFSKSFLAVFWHLQTTGTDPSASDRLYGGGLLGVPLGTGLCAPSYCAGWQLWWGPVYAALLVIAAVLAYRSPRTPESGMRLALAVAALITVVSYARNSSAGDSPIESARYLSCLLISTPAWLEPLWRAIAAPVSLSGEPSGVRSVARPNWQRLAAGVPLAAGVAMAVYATAALAVHVPTYTDAAAGQPKVIAALAAHDQTRLYADYWTCNWISYQTGEERICAVVGDDLTEGLNRYHPYWDEVGAAREVTYLAPIGSPLDATLAAAFPDRPMETAANYHLYLPTRPLPDTR